MKNFALTIVLLSALFSVGCNKATRPSIVRNPEVVEILENQDATYGAKVCTRNYVANALATCDAEHVDTLQDFAEKAYDAQTEDDARSNYREMLQFVRANNMGGTAFNN